MGCLFQTFKIVIIILTLVNIGTGYAKFYHLLADIVDKVQEIKDIKSVEDLIWIPFLIVQVSSTVFQFIMLYCLFRELCENNYMYKDCFKCCFILTMLIYTISVLPKSIITIVYYNYSSSVTKWWKSVADFFDSLLSGFTALGFQIILFMPVILRTCRSAGMCKRKISPERAKSNNVDTDLDDVEKESVENANCCLLACCMSTRNKKSFPLNETSGVTVTEKKTSNSRMKNMKRKVKHTVNKGIEMKSRIENKKNQMEAKVNRIKVKQAEKLEKKLEDGKTRIRAKVTKQPNETEEDVSNECDADKVIKKETVETGETNKCAVSSCLTSCRSKVCLCLNNRTRCFIISMALANVHLLVYFVEVVFILCFNC